MRKSPDGNREVIEMLVPVEGSISKTIRFSGLGLPDKIVIAEKNVDPTSLFDIVNRYADLLTYDTYQVIRGGLTNLAKTPIQENDQTIAMRSGGTFEIGTANVEKLKPGEIRTISPDDSSPGPTMSWIISTAESSYLLVAPQGLNSFDLAELLKDYLQGEYLIEMISAGIITASEAEEVPGWRLIVEPKIHLPAPEHIYRLN